MIHKDVFKFHESLQDPKVMSFYYSLSGSDRDDLLKMLLELHSPIYALDDRLHKLRKKRKGLTDAHPDVDKYVESATERLDRIALLWFKEKDLIDQ